MGTSVGEVVGQADLQVMGIPGGSRHALGQCMTVLL